MMNKTIENLFLEKVNCFKKHNLVNKDNFIEYKDNFIELGSINQYEYFYYLDNKSIPIIKTYFLPFKIYIYNGIGHQYNDKIKITFNKKEYYIEI